MAIAVEVCYQPHGGWHTSFFLRLVGCTRAKTVEQESVPGAAVHHDQSVLARLDFIPEPE